MPFDVSTIFNIFLSAILEHPLFFLATVVIVVLLIVIQRLIKIKKPQYLYGVKNMIMTSAEFEFFKTLRSVVEARYDVFAQVHLDAIFDYKIHGQNWKSAFHRINQKSVDFLLCDKESGRPIVALELDDPSHEKEERVLRDEKVDQIFRDANFALRRFKQDHVYTHEDIQKELFEFLQ